MEIRGRPRPAWCSRLRDFHTFSYARYQLFTVAKQHFLTRFVWFYVINEAFSHRLLGNENNLHKWSDVWVPPDRPSWILLLEHITRKCLVPCCGLCLHHSSSSCIIFSSLTQDLHWIQTFLNCVLTVRWCCYGMRKASGLLSWPPTSSELTGTRRRRGESHSQLCRLKVWLRNCV